MGQKTTLFVAEAATLAHVARPLALIDAVRTMDHEVFFACDPRSRWLVEKSPVAYAPLASAPPEAFMRALEHGTPVYDEATLRRYVRDDLDLLNEVRPDVVVGDFRLSLSVSARLARVPYLALSNAYWSPFGQPRYVVPNLPLTRLLPVTVADALFRLARPAAFALHAMPLNRIRKENGLPSLGTDLRKVYTDADQTLYADLPHMFKLDSPSANHHFIGPILWSPPVPTPSWWAQVPTDRPVVYLTLGSSGARGLLPAVVQALADLPIYVLVATAGAPLAERSPNVFVAEYLPGEEAARRARLVICNGGSPTSQQALSAGVPVIGIASNLDQFLNMGAIAQQGCGTLLRCDRFSPHELREAVLRTIRSSQAYEAAGRFRRLAEEYSATERFAHIVRHVLSGEQDGVTVA